MVSFTPANDIPSLSGKVILVTGSNTGLGKQSIIDLARHNPSQIWLAARSLEKAQGAITDIKAQVPTAPIHPLQLDLASLDSIKAAAKTFLNSATRLDILMLNAGIMATPPGTTKDGYEIQFGTNHVGHALLTKLLMPLLLQTAEGASSDVRVVVLSSTVHAQAPEGGVQFNTLKTRADAMETWTRYGQSKLANVLFGRELAKRYPQIKVVSVHPGIVNTNLTDSYMDSSMLRRTIRPFFMPLVKMVLTSVEDGVKNQLWAATSKDIVSGEYYEPVGKAGKASGYAKDEGLARKLWDWTEKQFQE
ncbi:putative short-chain dehydrogenase reductase protein [Ilyonectria robusta]